MRTSKLSMRSIGPSPRAVLVVALIGLVWGDALSASQKNRRPKPNVEVGAKTVPAPRAVLGFTPGDDRKLASWAQIVDYFRKLSQTSDRVLFQEIGKTTLGRPFVFATISSPANLARLDHFKEIQNELADPRVIKSDDAVADRLIAEGRTIVLI